MRRSVAILTLLATACSDAGVTKFNTDPTAELTSHAEGDSVREGYPETLRAVVGDANHPIDALSVAWFIGDAAVCTDAVPDNTGVTTCDHTFVPDGGEVLLEVLDPEGGSGTARVTLDVQPTDAPEAEITEPTADGTYYSDHLITFQGTVSDSEDEASALTVSWETADLGDLGLESDVTTEGAVEAFGRLDEGEHAVRLRAIDSTGKEASDSVVITVGPPNSAPTCEITAPIDGSASASGDEVRFEALVADVDVSPTVLSAVWSSDVDDELRRSTPDTDGSTGFASNTLTVATHRITLTVTDEVGAECTDSIYYTVGTPPTLTVTAPSSGDVANEQEPVTFTATVSDNEDLPTDIALSWTSDVDGEVSTQGADSTGAISFSLSSLTTGDHVLTVRATDTDSLYAETSLNLTINAVPTAPTVSISPDPATTDDNLTASATGSTDPDGSGTVTYSYAWHVDGVPSSVSTSATFPSSDTQKHSTYRVVVTPSDGTGDGDPGESELTVVNSDPVVTGVTLSASTAQVGETLTCSATGTDADADSVTFTYSWSDGSTGDTYTLTSTDDPGDTITCTATADDGDGGTATDTASATVDNSDPVVTTVSISPDPANNDDTLTCAGTATDPDGDAATFSYAWAAGTAGSLGTGASIDLSATTVASLETVTCTATATDPDGGTATDTGSLTLSNRDPSVTASISPATGATYADTLTCTAAASDDDGDTTTTTFSWTVESTSVAATSTAAASSTLSGAFVKGDVVECTATADDGKSGSASHTTSTTIGNAPPTLTTPTLAPDPGYTNDTLTANVTYADPDGDSVSMSYEWYVDGTSVQDGSDNTLSGATFFDKGQAVYVVATADDGTDTTSDTSATLTVANTPPGAPTVEIRENCVAVDFDGIDDAIDVGSYAGLSLGSTFTLEAWVKWDGTDTNRYQSLFSQNTGNNSGIHEWQMAVTTSASSACGGGYSSGAILMEMWGGGACSYSTTTLTPGAWQHVAAVYTGGQINIFIDGIESTNVWRTNTRTLAASEPLALGWGSDNGEDWAFSGSMDSARVSTSARYSGTFTPQELSADADTLSLWRIDENSGTLVPDDAGAYDGIIDGATWVADCATEPYLVCLINMDATDDDGDTVTYSFEWTDDSGSAYTAATSTYETGDTVPAGDFGGLEDWTCTVTPNDGTDDGTTGSATITTTEPCDVDRDGYDSTSAACGGTDCNDGDATIHPFAGDTYGDGVDSDCDALDCNADFSGSTYFTACFDALSWSTAESTCISAGYDGLATILDSVENNDLSLMLHHDSSPSNNDLYWIGYTDASSEGSWRWSSGLGVSYINWHPGEPNGGTNENCGHIYSAVFTQYGRWNDHRCGTGQSYICEYR